MGFADNVSLSKYGTYKKIFETENYAEGDHDQKETLEIEDDFMHIAVRLEYDFTFDGGAWHTDIPDFARAYAILDRLKMYPAKRNTRYMEMMGKEYLYYQALFTREDFLCDTMPTGQTPVLKLPYDAILFIPHVGYNIKEFGEMEIEFDIANLDDIITTDGDDEFTDIKLHFYAFYGEPKSRIFTGTPFEMLFHGIRQKEDGLTKGLTMVGQIVNAYDSYEGLNGGSINGIIDEYEFRQAGGDIIVGEEPDIRLISHFNFHSLINPWDYRDLMGFDFPKPVNVNDTTLFYIDDDGTVQYPKTGRIIPLYEDTGA